MEERKKGRKEKIGNFLNKSNNNDTQNKKQKKKGLATFWLILITIIVVAVAVIVVVIVSSLKSKVKNEPVFSAETMLKDVFDIAELSGAKYTYNGVAKVLDKEGKDKYYVKYDGSVNVGINFEDIEVSTDEKNKRITIMIPKCEFSNEPRANLENLEYIFIDEEYNKEKVSEEAYKAANKDLYSKVSSDKKFFEVANENMRTTIEALTQPIVNQFAPEYILTVQLKEEIK